MRAFTIILMIIGGFAACTNSRTKQIGSFMKDKKGKIIQIPDSISVKELNIDSTYSHYSSKEFINSKSFKIVTSINGDCHACVNQLTEWKSVISKFSDSNVRFLFFIYADNYARFELMNMHEINFEYPVVYDYNNDFTTNNKIPDDYLLNTMLIDSHDKILVIGNPLKSQEILKLYEDVITIK